ncbi:MAG TPA: hypothetical protein PLP25_00395 [Candidatus Limiplasma sp.]|nr:hypothetical protein [Candidatus Limiplasma sp.]HPS80301.1 hypothetical protein [Candidatus Limiplasma sp.]
MSDSLFRKNAVDRVVSPDQLNSTIRVVPTGIWLVLVAVILALAAILLFLATTDLDLLGLLFG